MVGVFCVRPVRISSSSSSRYRRRLLDSEQSLGSRVLLSPIRSTSQPQMGKDSKPKDSKPKDAKGKGKAGSSGGDDAGGKGGKGKGGKSADGLGTCTYVKGTAW